MTTVVPLKEIKKPSRSEVRGADRFEKAGYRIVGRHSAVKVCHWTKSALRGGKPCYKSWYGIESHRCIQMTPSVQYCNMMCVFCWRFHTLNRVQPFEGEWDSPTEILDKMVEVQRQLLSGFGGNSKVSKQKFKEALEPKHIAISLDGEPTLYPRLGEFIQEATKRGMTTFLVSNGTMPERLEQLLANAQPTSLYISVYGPDKETHIKTCKPLINDSWERLLRSLELMSKFSSRKVIRLTLVKDLNMHGPELYAELIKKASPDFIECKGYTHVGESQMRLRRENMPSMKEINAFAMELASYIGFIKVAEDEVSRIVLLADPESPYYLSVAKGLSTK
ncbi:MAG: 4-demethylwyosine synthase TYW1 [Candidatus Caldarchaeum sp.]|nr:4-demethylwyosine synthase TYW1 [Candidatus Caldarchaeum sp.]MDW8062639.1 4-demethylwyosine synthase TYW1 [Candidatus Caldarchaeum sp.]